MTTTFDMQQRDRLATILNAYLDAITALLTANVQEYTLNTGQGSQRVTRLDLQQLQENYGLLYRQYDALVSRCGNGGLVQLVPEGAAPWLDRI
ncbi:hypothetical protein [Vibrio phage VP16T]|nr:hypothetical protein [Vibrio phage VP16T]